MIDKFISRYARSVFHFCRNLTGNSNTDDLTQEVFIRLNRYLQHHKLDEKRLGGLVFSIANSVCIDHLRKAKNEHKLIKTLTQNYKAANSLRTPQEEFIHNEMTAEMDQAIRKMPFKLKQIFLLRVHSDLKFIEISKLLSLPLNTVLARMHYALNFLKKELRNVQAV